MTLLTLLLPDVDLPSTLENAGVTPERSPEIEDPQAYDEVIAEGLERGAQRLAEAGLLEG